MFLLRCQLIVMLLPTLFVGCGEATARNERPADAVVIHGAGSTFAAPLYREWSKVYRTVRPKVYVEYDSVGSGEGQSRFVKGSIDFGGTDSVLSSEQLAQVEGGVASIPIASGGIVLAYNPATLPEKVKLPRDVYPDIFLGKITHWDDPRIAAANPGARLPNRTIAVVVRSDSSGTTNAFTSHLSAVSDEWRNGPGAGKSVSWPIKVRQSSGNERVAGTIMQTHDSIGYVEFGHARAMNLRMATLENKSREFVPPSNQSIQLAASGLGTQGANATDVDPAEHLAYPIVTHTWLLLRKKPAGAARSVETADFVRWCLGDGQHIAESLGYVRLSPERAAESLKIAETVN